jgi:hypothetical protein
LQGKNIISGICIKPSHQDRKDFNAEDEGNINIIATLRAAGACLNYCPPPCYQSVSFDRQSRPPKQKSRKEDIEEEEER